MSNRTILSGINFSSLLMLAIGWFVSAAGLAQIQASEYDLKAAFLYQFTSYVSWPEDALDPDAALLFGVVGAPELADNLARLANAPNGEGRSIEVRRMNAGDDPAGLHVLFVAGRQSRAAATMLQAAQQHAVLTVTEDDAPRPQYSVINFEILDGKVRFDISLDNARASDLTISARLLQVALRVLGAP